MTTLNNDWSLYYFKSDKSKKWIENMHKVIEFNTIEKFWNIMHHVKPVSNIPYGCDYYLFRSNIKPMWENEFNKNGGMWVISSHKSQRETTLNQLWLEILIFLIGETSNEDSDEICGAAINVRGMFDKITVWTRDSSNINANRRIGMGLKSVLKLKQSIEYIAHCDNITKADHSKVKALITV